MVFPSLIFALLLQVAASGTHQQGVDAYRQTHYDEAIQKLTQALPAEPPGTPSYNESVLLIGQSYFMLQQAPKAIPWLTKLPDSNEANYMLGYAYLQVRDVINSRRSFARLFHLAPDSAAGHLLAGQMMLKKDFDAEASTEVQKAIEMDGKLPEAHFVLAEIDIFRGRIDEGIKNLQIELTINPNFAMAWYRLGDAYARTERYAEAIPQLQRAIWLNPDFSGPFILLGKSYLKTGNYANADGILRRALQLDPQNYSATYLLGQTLIAEGKQDEGRKVLEQARELQRQRR